MLSAKDVTRGKMRKRMETTVSEEPSGGEDSSVGEVLEAKEETIDVFTQAKTQVKEELSRVTGSSRFNPNPDEAEVKQLRKGYARLLTEIRLKKSDLVRPEDTRLNDMLEDANSLVNYIHTTIDATLDSRFMAISAELGADKINKLATGSMDFNISDVCNLVKSALIRTSSTTHLMASIASNEGGMGTETSLTDHYGWNVLGDIAMKHWRGVTTPDFFLGPISVPIKEKQPRNKAGREKKALEPVVQPRVIDGQHQAIMTGTEVETTSNVITVFQCLQKVAPLPFYKFIIDPTSYSRTVENIFYVSFLVNDNRIKLEYEKGRELIIHIIIDDDGDEIDEETIRPKHQAIYSMTMRLWREMIAKYDLTKPIITL